ncbi:MAG: antibiotic biosynthesis monooxygenase [Sphingomonadales bacterium]|nr:MAG: antibiotic biosynthesis monooxygenase [Sphingomonadales bacterium]TNF06365.1 MAG: antibiotic biosynthesis monooxygenase [Sphingomonadales bacterium]
MIVITGQIFTDPETYPELMARLRELELPSRAEDGCVFYHMAGEDPETGTILVAEGWRDMDALNTHFALPAIVKLLADFKGRYTNDITVHEVSASHKM